MGTKHFQEHAISISSKLGIAYAAILGSPPMVVQENVDQSTCLILRTLLRINDEDRQPFDKCDEEILMAMKTLERSSSLRNEISRESRRHAAQAKEGHSGILMRCNERRWQSKKQGSKGSRDYSKPWI